MPAGLLPFDEALAALIARAAPLEDVETVPTIEAAGRVLAAPQRSALDVPADDNTSMDGYAVRCADFMHAGPAGVRLRVAQRIPAGRVGAALLAGTAARIFTGATIPEGADAVVAQEQAEPDGEFVLVRQAPQPGDWIRRAGEDIRAGSVILPAGTRLSPQATGLAA